MNAGEVYDEDNTFEEIEDIKAMKKEISRGKVKKSLKVDKEIKVTTTIVKVRNTTKDKKIPTSVKR
jgi:hypothetical protein